MTLDLVPEGSDRGLVLFTEGCHVESAAIVSDAPGAYMRDGTDTPRTTDHCDDVIKALEETVRP